VFDARGDAARRETTRESDTDRGIAEVTCSQRPLPQVEHGRKVDLHPMRSQRPPGRPPFQKGRRRGRQPPRRARRRRIQERTHLATLLVDEHERTARSMQMPRRPVDEHPADARRRRQAGDDHERRLVLRAQRGEDGDRRRGSTQHHAASLALSLEPECGWI
jgi:hypothetical protein